MTQTTTAPSKPVPVPDDLTAPFFAGGGRGALVLQRCDVCASWVALGSRLCTECLSEKLTWADTSGLAKLYTFAIMHQQYHPTR